jgi:hypothetical protein
MRNRTNLALSALLGTVASLSVTPAFADGIETPAGGAVQMGRSGAWIARADDPLAAFVNPAAMVRNPNGVHVGSHLMFRTQCFTRLGEDGQPLAASSTFLAPTSPLCAEIAPFPNPQLAATFRIGRRFALGLAVVGPHKHGKSTWADTVSAPNKFGLTVPQPSGARYMLLDDDAVLVYPTLSAAVAVRSNLSLGAGLVWGIAKYGFSNMAAVTGDASTFSNDMKAQINGFDGFVPGFVLSALYSPTSRLDLAATYRYSDAIRSKADLYAQSNYYDSKGQVNTAGILDPANITDVKGAASFNFQLPMEARLGVRYHHPRYQSMNGTQAWLTKHQGAVRDGMSEDLFDIEADLTWSHNSAVENIEIRLAEGTQLNVGGTTAPAPLNADVARNWRDVFGARVGGEYVVIPDFVAVRAGGFVETKGVDDAYLSLDFQQAMKAGVSAGATVRVAMVDVTVGYMHTFFGTLDNGGKGAVYGLSGDPNAGFRTPQVINGGRLTGRLDEFALGVTAHF